jgi:hypothetical protein
MSRHHRALLALALVLVVLGGVTAMFAQAAAPAQTQAPTQWVKIFRGLADVQYTKPVSKRDKGDVVTVMVVKNTSSDALARLQVEEFWYDAAGNPVGGGKDVCKKPLPPGDTYTFTLPFPHDPKMFSNKYMFSHANGQVKPKLVPKF